MMGLDRVGLFFWTYALNNNTDKEGRATFILPVIARMTGTEVVLTTLYLLILTVQGNKAQP